MFKSLFLSAVVAFGLAACAGEPSTTRESSAATVTPIPPYTVFVEALDDVSGPRLLEVLEGIEGVDGVELELGAGKATVQTTAGAFLYEPQVRAAMATAGLELTSFQVPSEAMVTVYVVETEPAG